MAMSVQKTMNKVLTNKYVLYLVLFLSVTNILGYMAVGNFNSVILFILIAFLTQYFSKNMTIVLLSAMFGTSILYVTHNFGIKLKEGMDNPTNKSNKQSPKNRATNSVNNESNETPTPKINEQQTLRDNMETIQSMMGKVGMENITKDTESLINKQDELKRSMESLKPMIDTANGLLNSIDGEALGKISGLLEKFGGLGKK